MERRPTSILTTLTLSLLALTLIAPWALRQDQDRITEIRRQAEQGDAIAQYILGYRYATGIGVPQDRAEAAGWLRLAADQGHIQTRSNATNLDLVSFQGGPITLADYRSATSSVPTIRMTERALKCC